MPEHSDTEIPVLTDVVGAADRRDRSGEAPDRQARIDAASAELAERLANAVADDLAAALAEKISAGLRRELPQLIETLLEDRPSSGTDNR